MQYQSTQSVNCEQALLPSTIKYTSEEVRARSNAIYFCFNPFWLVQLVLDTLTPTPQFLSFFTLSGPGAGLQANSKYSQAMHPRGVLCSYGANSWYMYKHKILCMKYFVCEPVDYIHLINIFQQSPFERGQSKFSFLSFFSVYFHF